METDTGTQAIKITTETASKLLGLTKQFIRVGLQQSRLPFGSAVRMKSTFRYDIRPHMLASYMGISMDELYRRLEVM